MTQEHTAQTQANGRGDRLRRFVADIGRRDLYLLLGALVCALAVRVAYWLVTRDHALAGDEIEYHREGLLWVAGHPFWSDAVYGVPRPSAWKAPGYPAWVGTIYTIFGASPSRLTAVQTLLGPLNAFFVFLLARRLAGQRAGLIGAYVWAVYPPAFQYEQLLYSEGLAAVTTSVLLLALWRRDGGVTPVRAAAGFGGLLGLAILLRPSAGFMLLPAAAFWLLTTGWRRTVSLSVVAAGCAVLVVSPVDDPQRDRVRRVPARFGTGRFHRGHVQRHERQPARSRHVRLAAAGRARQGPLSEQDPAVGSGAAFGADPSRARLHRRPSDRRDRVPVLERPSPVGPPRAGSGRPGRCVRGSASHHLAARLVRLVARLPAGDLRRVGAAATQLRRRLVHRRVRGRDHAHVLVPGRHEIPRSGGAADRCPRRGRPRPLASRRPTAADHERPA